ncbi:hypothetical protein BGZ76_004714 [Entomortierella beljakovae]|nr:hypothetical protein BGZ76_004714 [Entomortierella beljakovae]
MLDNLHPRKRSLVISYGWDWVLVIVVLAVFTFVDTLEPFHRQFSVADTTIQHPFAKKETIPVWLAGVLAFILPGAVIGAVSILKRKSYADLHNGLLGLFLAQALVLVVTDSIKIAVGRPRPDFLDRCFSIYDNAEAGTPVTLLVDPLNMLSNSTICTRTELLKDGFKSFPSGHSSFSFGGLGYLSMYLAGKLKLFDERGHIYKSIVVLAPLILAALIATSRVDDYRHHWQDVTVGAFIGIIFAVFSYRQYYPSLAAPKSGRPFSPRTFGEHLAATLLPLRNDHEDEERPDNNTTQSFLNNVGGSGTYQRDGTMETLSSTSLHEMSNSHNSFSNNSQYDQDQSRRAQSPNQRGNDTYLGPLA